MTNIGIYVHIPFCNSKCKYCDFVSFANAKNYQLKYLDAITKEIISEKNVKQNVDTIYIGGGTPSAFIDGGICTIINTIKQNFNVLPNAEISIEVNPNSLNYAKINEYKECGINRISIGLQTSNINLLKILGRNHTLNDYLDCIKLIKDFNFDNISTDIMLGLPRQKLKDVKYTLKILLKNNIPHISAYSLIVEDNTILKDEIGKGNLKIPKEEKTLSMYNYVLNTLRKYGYIRYEVSNFCKPNYECKHNLHTWQYAEYLGFGVAAHSFYKGERFYNTSNLQKYLTNQHFEYCEKITSEDANEEKILLGMRTNKGVDLNNVKVNKDTMKSYIKCGFLQIKNNKLYATDSGFLVLNSIILNLLP